MTITDYRRTRSNQTCRKKLPLVFEDLAFPFRFKETIPRFLEIIHSSRPAIIRPFTITRLRLFTGN